MPGTLSINLRSARITQTNAEWSSDATIYPDNKILVTSDVLYHGTNQPRYKLANGIHAWSALDYVPSPILNYTRFERDAIVSPQAGDRIFNIDDQRIEYYHSFFGWHPAGIITPDWGYFFNDEGIGISGVFSFSGGGTNVTIPAPAFSPTAVIGMSTLAGATTGRSFMNSAFFRGQQGKKQYVTKVLVNALSTSTDRYILAAGYSNMSSGTANADGMFFLYDEGGIFGSLATASPNWICVCRNGGSYSFQDSGVPVLTTAASQMQTLEILDYGNGSLVEFKINGVLVASITTNIPSSSIVFGIGNRIQKTTGTNAAIMYFDYVFHKEKFNIQRL